MDRIRLMAMDVDGTLLPAGTNYIPERVIGALRSAAGAGIELVPASGRMLTALPQQLLDMPEIRYAISCNGATVTNRRTGEIIYRRWMPAGLAVQILRKVMPFQAYTSVYMEDGAHNWDWIPPELWQHYGSRIHIFQQDPHRDLTAYVEQRGGWAEKVFIAVFRQDEREAVRKVLEEIPGITITTSSSTNLEVSQAGTGKGAALAWLARKLEIPPEQVLAMGDNENDVSMLRFAGIAVVPENGTPAAKAEAAERMPDCADEGAAAFLTRMFRGMDKRYDG